MVTARLACNMLYSEDKSLAREARARNEELTDRIEESCIKQTLRGGYLSIMRQSAKPILNDRRFPFGICGVGTKLERLIQKN